LISREVSMTDDDRDSTDKKPNFMGVALHLTCR
jgi:hypothetical protein